MWPDFFERRSPEKVLTNSLRSTTAPPTEEMKNGMPVPEPLKLIDGQSKLFANRLPVIRRQSTSPDKPAPLARSMLTPSRKLLPSMV